MAKYNKVDFEHATTVLSNVDTIKTDIDDLKDNITDYSIKLLVKLEGQAATKLASILKYHYNELNALSKKVGLVSALKTNNSSVVGAFGGEYDSLDDSTITDLKEKIDDTKRKIAMYSATVSRFSESNDPSLLAIRNYKIFLVRKYQSLLREIEPLYNDMKEKMDAVKSADTEKINITL